MISSYGTLNDRSPHLIADLMEIVCFFEDRLLSRGDVETFVNSYGGTGLMSALKIVENEDNSDSAETNDRIQQLSEDVFAHLFYRSAAFKQWYPFNVDGDVVELKKKFQNKHRIYLLMLVCSRLKMLPENMRGRFAAHFEALSVVALECLFKGWEVIHFGAGGKHRTEFGTKFKVAIRALALKLKDVPIQERIDAISEQNSGDGGVDIVVVNTFSDLAAGSTSFFVQCAAQQIGWPEKKLEASSVLLAQFMSCFHPPGNILAIPVCYRNTDGKWVDDAAFPAVLLDRLRLTKLLANLPIKAIAAAAASIPQPLRSRMQ